MSAAMQRATPRAAITLADAVDFMLADVQAPGRHDITMLITMIILRFAVHTRYAGAATRR